VIEMRVGVNNADDFQAMRIKARHDQVRITTRVDDDGFFADRVADDGAVALERADGKGFADERCVRGLHGFDPDAKACHCGCDAQN
jgi:hypothetical protein